MIYNGVEVQVYKEWEKGSKIDVRTIHTLDHFVDNKPNTCPFDDSIILYGEECIKCKNRAHYKNGDERPSYTIECLAFDVRKRRHKGDALMHTERIVIYPK